MNAALDACGRVGRIKEALELMKDARASGIELDVVSYNGAIPACTESGDWQQAVSMIKEMEAEYGIEPNHVTFLAVIKVRSAFESVSAARRFFFYVSLK